MFKMMFGWTGSAPLGSSVPKRIIQIRRQPCLLLSLGKKLRDIWLPCKIYLLCNGFRFAESLVPFWRYDTGRIILKSQRVVRIDMLPLHAPTFLPYSLHPQIKWTSLLPIFYNLPSMNGTSDATIVPAILSIYFTDFLLICVLLWLIT